MYFIQCAISDIHYSVWMHVDKVGCCGMVVVVDQDVLMAAAV
jgi:hypothetical protein